jgi:hypothetical protein
MHCSSSRTVLGLMSLLLFSPLVLGQNQVADATRKLSQLNGQLLHEVQTAPPEVKQAVSEVPPVNPAEIHEITAPQNPARKIAVVSDNQKELLVSAVTNFTQEKKRQETKYSWLALIFVVAGASCALIASIFNFVKWNTMAGIVGLIVIAVVGFPNVYPIPALADFYGALATQAVALQTDCELKTPFTEEDYTSAENQLKYLILYDATNRPKLGTTKVSTEDLTKQLQTYKTSANLAAKSAP